MRNMAQASQGWTSAASTLLQAKDLKGFKAHIISLHATLQLAELRPKTPKTMRQTSAAAVAMTTVLYALISIGSYLVFGRGTQSDVLHNYTPSLLEEIVPRWLAQLLYIVVRLSFLLGVLTLFPLMVRPYQAYYKLKLLKGRISLAWFIR